MRLLKQKVMRALERNQLLSYTQQVTPEELLEDDTSLPTEEETHQIDDSLSSSDPNLLNEDGETRVKRRKRSSMGNNIMKNYCRAFVNFGLSDLANPYLNKREEIMISTQRFRQILEAKKRKVNCIKSLRSLLLHVKHESREMDAFKCEFQRLCEVFLKYFCVNWIFHSKVADKIKHLHYRGKMLRRIQNPEFFTYLEEFGKRKST